MMYKDATMTADPSAADTNLLDPTLVPARGPRLASASPERR